MKSSSAVFAEGLRMDGYEADTCLDGDEGLELCTMESMISSFLI